MNKQLVILLLSAVLLNSAGAQDYFTPGVHHYADTTLNYQVMYPENFDENKRYPMVLFLHGAGERGDDNKKQLVHGSSLFASDSNRNEFPAVVIFPQCPKEDYWASIDVTLDENGKRQFKFVSTREATVAMQGVMNLVDSLKTLSFINNEQMYLGGLSMGGMGTFDLLSRRPDTFKKAFAICGGGDLETVANYATKVDLWVFHGEKDDVVLPKFSRQITEAIKSLGGNVKLTLYPEANHNSWDPTFNEPELLPWLFSN